MRIAVRRKWIVVGLTAAGLVMGAAWLYARDYGPYLCSSCSLGTPYPDVATYAYLDVIAPDIGFRWTETGNTYIVCNGSACGYYRVTSSGDFHGDKVVQQQFAPPPGSGGGGGSVGGGGGIPGVGTGTGGSDDGTVVVRPIKKVTE